MLSCHEVQQRADALVDGDPLSFRERMALRMHLLMCHHCRRFVRQLRQLVASLRREAEPASPQEVEKVMRALDSSQKEN